MKDISCRLGCASLSARISFTRRRPHLPKHTDVMQLIDNVLLRTAARACLPLCLLPMCRWGGQGCASALGQARLTVFALVCFCTAVPQPARLSMPWYVCRRLFDFDAAISRSRLASAPSCACQCRI
jgi:hypothetical protein